MILVLVEVVKNIKNVVVNNEEILSYFHPYYFNHYLYFLSTFEQSHNTKANIIKVAIQMTIMEYAVMLSLLVY